MTAAKVTDRSHADESLTMQPQQPRMRVYYDTVIMSARVKKDLPPVETAAVDRIEQLHDEERIKRVTSKMARIEQSRRIDPVERALLLAHGEEVSGVPNDHRLLGFNSMADRLGGFISYPIVDDIVNPERYAKLQAVIKDADDAKHLMYAAENDCAVFVTLDNRDILPNRAKLEAICGLRILKPTELVAELDGGLP